ncbi:PqiC family protein [Litchfieldella rifensis]|uniref:Membrane integrity-associated transporter subunit PqiC n=1 Tax=Litchfieldella rifensis TaxID=762643 RepID=A0ABV7LT18_9GAMM
MIAIRLLGLLIALSLVTGCASSPASATRYTLPEGSDSVTEGKASAPYTLVVRPLRVADYLDAEGIVLQLDDITLNQAREHQWAEDLSRQLERGLRQRLANRLPDTHVLSDDVADTDSLRLLLTVDRFQGRYDGLAIAGGQWQLRDARGRLLAQESFSAETELDADGYPALVRALGRSWDKVADRLAERIVELR